MSFDDKKDETIDSETGAPRKGHEREHYGAPGRLIQGGFRFGQHESYWVLSEEERAKGFVRPVRDAYVHAKCGTVTRMGRALSETYARDPSFYGETFCCHCCAHFPVAEFTWADNTDVVGS